MLISIIAIRPVTLRNLARWSQSFRPNLLTLFMALLGLNFIGMENAQIKNLGTLGISNGESSYRAWNFNQTMQLVYKHHPKHKNNNKICYKCMDNGKQFWNFLYQFQ